MGQAAVQIPEKIYFKIGEVCDLVGVQAHVLRYWETEFPQLSPQKNRSGQRSYRRRDVEIALRIKELLYDDLFTIAGARKRLQAEARGESPKLKIVRADAPGANGPAHPEPGLFDDEVEIGEIDTDEPAEGEPAAADGSLMTAENREALRKLASELLELREMLKSNGARDLHRNGSV